jgi:hypothetical protein
MQQPRGKLPVRDVEKWPGDGRVAMAPRRLQRCRKLWEFQAKKPTGRTAVRLSKLPSTRQKTGSLAGAGGFWFGIFGFWSIGLDNDVFA